MLPSPFVARGALLQDTWRTGRSSQTWTKQGSTPWVIPYVIPKRPWCISPNRFIWGVTILNIYVTIDSQHIFCHIWHLLRAKKHKKKQIFPAPNQPRLRFFWEEQWIPQRVPWSCCGGLGAQWFVATGNSQKAISWGNPNMFLLRYPGRKNCFGPNVRCWSMLVPRSTLEGHIFDDEMFQFLARAKDRTREAWCLRQRRSLRGERIGAGPRAHFLMEKPKLFLWEWIWGMFLGPGPLISTRFPSRFPCN